MKTPMEVMAAAPWCEMVCKKYSPLHWKDLRQELFLLIATDLAEKAQKALDNGYFEFFYIRCAANLSGSGGRIGRINIGGEDIADWELVSELPDERRQAIEADVQEKLDAIALVQSEQDWYESKLVEMYLDGWSARKIHRTTKIALNEVCRVINTFKRRCHEEYK